MKQWLGRPLRVCQWANSLGGLYTDGGKMSAWMVQWLAPEIVSLFGGVPTGGYFNLPAAHPIKINAQTPAPNFHRNRTLFQAHGRITARQYRKTLHDRLSANLPLSCTTVRRVPLHLYKSFRAIEPFRQQRQERAFSSQ